MYRGGRAKSIGRERIQNVENKSGGDRGGRLREREG